MSEMTIKGFLTKDVSDFAYSKGYQDTVNDEPNPTTKAQHCKNYLRMMFRNDIKAYRLAESKKEVEEPTEPNISVI